MPQSRVGLQEQGLVNLGRMYWNLCPAVLVELALARREGILASTGALAVKTGSRTGRSPKDKFIVEDPASHDQIHWGRVNRPFPRDRFESLYTQVLGYLQGRDVFVVDAMAGADPRYQVPIRVVNELAWHNLFARQLFRRISVEEQHTHRPEYTVIAAPGFQADPSRHGTHSEAFVILDLERKLVLIGGTRYAGEMKKSVFSALNYELPRRGVFPMHCAANVGAEGDVALFFGLSGTGKTSLSADPKRCLIGDDEHGWSDDGVFNFEGGCYAKCFRLSRKYEPQIWNALCFGSVLENVILDPETRVPDYDDDSVTENTRAAYPVEFIENAMVTGVAGHPTAVLFLAADAFGILPPISRLSRNQALFHFLSGYTAKLAGTETGMGDEPEATFSTCFGAPFLPLAPGVYADMLGQRLDRHGSRVYLVNTGWVGGPYGVGSRISISYTRAMVDAAITGRLDGVAWRTDPVFGIEVPAECPGVPPELLDQRSNWASPAEYDHRARELADRFIRNFAQFKDVPKEISQAGPRPG
ncbi:MAG TPA: phosphoenolpyruvate carboxykinase (ATP) [Armatimonadetes bacterium]|jgi:phosphoenolpyruvate carboxykinase (ATP)|nr:phosphoenolpyruvate carboxykinase (ATP) [Armatimonadota bacterium]